MTTFVAVAAGTVPLCIGGLVTGEFLQLVDISLSNWLLILYVSVVTTAFNWVVWFWGIGEIGVVKIAPLFFVIPVSGVLFSWLLLGEQLTISVLLGLLLIVGSIYIVQVREDRSVGQGEHL